MNINKTVNQNSVKLTVEGRISNNTSDEFQLALLKALEETQKVILDLAKLVYINSAGLRALLIGMKKADEASRSLVIRNVSREVLDLFEMTGFNEILIIE
ncbi:MAG: STAS domain-containing protein [Anaerocolumna sp.]